MAGGLTTLKLNIDPAVLSRLQAGVRTPAQKPVFELPTIIDKKAQEIVEKVAKENDLPPADEREEEGMGLPMMLGLGGGAALLIFILMRRRK